MKVFRAAKHLVHRAADCDRASLLLGELRAHRDDVKPPGPLVVHRKGDSVLECR